MQNSKELTRFLTSEDVGELPPDEEKWEVPEPAGAEAILENSKQMLTNSGSVRQEVQQHKKKGSLCLEHNVLVTQRREERKRQAGTKGNVTAGTSVCPAVKQKLL